MACLTSEQLASYALELENAEVPPHVHECPACEERLAQMRGLREDLAAAHSELSGRHTESRELLLSQISSIELSACWGIKWKRFAFGGLGLSSAAAVLLLMTVFASSSSRLSAMDRIVNAVRDVTSFSYKLTNYAEYPPSKDKPARTLDGNTFTFWRAPAEGSLDQFGDLRGAQTHEWIYHESSGDQEPKVTLDITEIHPSGKRGMLIDYVAKKFFRVPPLHAGDIANSTPLLWLHAVREKTGKIVDDLGFRRINGRQAHGYTMTFDDESSFSGFGPVEVWVDSETDLPVEFSFQYAQDQDGIEDKFSVTDITWNIDLDPKLFDTTPPAGFLDVTMPDDEKSIAEIVAALELYAELSGGRYPLAEELDDRYFATKFDAEACYREMLEMAGFTGTDQDEWADDPIYQRIEQSRPGLDTLQRILQSYKWLIGYNGSVTREDENKVLLWWNVALDADGDQYRVFYGDLRTEIVPREEWIRFVPPETAEIGE